MTLRGEMEGREGGSRERQYKCNCGWFTLLYGRNQHNIVKIKKKKKTFKNQHILKIKRLKQGRNTHLERKDVDILSNEKEHLFFHTYLTGPRILPKMPVQLFAKMDPTTEACGNMSTLTMGWCPLPFDLQGAFLHSCRRKVFLDLRSRHLISLLQQSSASATSFVLGMSGWKKVQSYSTWQTPAVQHRDPSISYVSCKREWCYVNKITLWLLKHNMLLKYKCYSLLLDNI